MYMIMFVLDDIELEEDILAVWAERGINGATIIESSGLQRRLKRIPMRYAYQGDVTTEVGNLTFMVIVDNEQKVKTCLECVEEVVGDLNQPHTGVFSAWPLTTIKGIPSMDKGND